MGIGIGELALILVIVLIVFGAGKLPNVMKDLGKGVKGFKDGVNDGEAEQSGKAEDKKDA